MENVEEKTVLSLREEFERDRVRCRILDINIGILNDDYVDNFGDKLQGELSTHPNTDYLICMNNMSFLSSSALEKLNSFSNEQYKRQERYVALGEIRKSIYEVFELTKMNRSVFRCFKTAEDYKENPFRDFESINISYKIFKYAFLLTL